MDGGPVELPMRRPNQVKCVHFPAGRHSWNCIALVIPEIPAHSDLIVACGGDRMGLEIRAIWFIFFGSRPCQTYKSPNLVSALFNVVKYSKHRSLSGARLHSNLPHSCSMDHRLISGHSPTFRYDMPASHNAPMSSPECPC